MLTKYCRLLTYLNGGEKCFALIKKSKTGFNSAFVPSI